MRGETSSGARNCSRISATAGTCSSSRWALGAGVAAGSVALTSFAGGSRVDSSATVSEAGQNQICAYLSLALLAGPLLNALAGWWWADPTAALVMAGFALLESRESWRGAACECC